MAHASPPPPPVQASEMEADVVSGSTRGVAEDFVVLPDGGELGGRLRTITADGGLGSGALKLTDVALFDLAAQWSIARHYELDATVSVLAKQPSSADAEVFQGGSLALRRDVARRTAISIAASAAPLVGTSGLAYGGSLFLTHKKRLNEIVAFSLAGGADTTMLRDVRRSIAEVAGHASVLVRIPNGIWGGWMGAGYAVPIYRRGEDPLSGMTLDPQPRLDLDIGTAVQLADDWDLSADLMILDRGDLANPATRLPVLDGGFDQVQLIIGVSRRIHGGSHGRHRGEDEVTDPLVQL